MRSMVEGYAVSSAAYDLPYPSTTLRVVPLPLRGRTSNGRFPSPPDIPLPTARANPRFSTARALPRLLPTR